VVIVVAQAWLLSDVVNRIFIRRQTLPDVLPFLSIMLLLALVRATFVWSGDVLAQKSANHLKGSLRADLTQRLFALGPAYTRDERSGELVNAVVEGVEVLDEYITLFQPLRTLAMIVPVFVALVVFVLDPPTVLILIFTGPVLVLFLALIGSRAKEMTEQRFVELSWMSAFFLDVLQGIATLKMFGRSKEQAANIEEISQHYGKTTMEVLATAFQTSLMMEWAATAATAMVALEASLRLMNGALPFDRALAVLLLTPEFFLPLRQMAIKYHSGTTGKAAAGRIYAILDTPLGQRVRESEDQRSSEPIATALQYSGTTLLAHYPTHSLPQHVTSPPTIRFEEVRFAYDQGQRPALHGFSLEVPRGQTVALVGPTGAGKTTVVSLLLRFVEPDAGQITVDGRPVREIEPALWRRRVAWVPQLPHLFHGTVADNILLARPDATPDQVVAAACAAHADEFICALPQGYDTPLGEQGARLSGGQRQRLAIARAFLKDAPVLILDEATASLDARSDALIRDALARLTTGRTVLVIAHRLELTYTADQVVVLDAGRAVETGTYESLLAQGGLYRQLVESYANGER